MCGILGLYDSSGIQPHYKSLQAANDIAGHRGPDGRGFALFETHSGSRASGGSLQSLSGGPAMEHADLALAHRRLAIIDLSQAGIQPMCTRDGQRWITYNGEVYNYLELRGELESLGRTFTTRTDTEVILQAYEQWGEGCVERFNGMWAFAIVDLEVPRIFCSRDRFGVKPFHYSLAGERFVFASEIKQLLLFPFVPKRINDQMVYDYLAYHIVEHCEETFFQGIHNLLPGHNLIFDLQGRSLTTRSFYNPRFSIQSKADPAESAEEFHELLKDSVRLRLRSDVHVGSCLSGGLDSSSIVCLMSGILREQGKNDIQHTFSSHFEEKEANELEYMETVVKAAGVKAHFTYPSPEGLLNELEKLVWHQEEPFVSTSIYAQWSVFKLAREHGVTVMLDGQGADELLGGYVPYSTGFYLQELLMKKRLITAVNEARMFHYPLLQLIRPMAVGLLRKSILSPVIELLKKAPWLYRTVKALRQGAEPAADDGGWLSPDLTKGCSGRRSFSANQGLRVFPEEESLNNYLYQSTFRNSLQALLKYEDRNSMAFSVEGRVPFLDYRLVEFLFSLPSSLKMKDGYSKHVMRQGLDGVLPEKIRKRITKLGFSTPEALWQKTALMPLIEHALEDPNLGAFIDPVKAKAHLLMIRASGRTDFTPWQWANLSLWMKVFAVTPS